MYRTIFYDNGLGQNEESVLEFIQVLVSLPTGKDDAVDLIENVHVQSG